MKKLNTIISILTLILFCNCSESKEEISNTNNTKIHISYILNGNNQNYIESEITIKPFGNNTSIEGKKTENGNGNTIETISIVLPPDYKVGTYNLNGTGARYIIWFASKSTTGIDKPTGTSGNLEITSVENNFVEGKFNFTGGHGTQNINVSNGSFKVKIN